MLLILIALGFVMAAFFSGSETALVSVNWIRLEHWLEKGRTGARSLVYKDNRPIAVVVPQSKVGFQPCTIAR